MLPRSTLNSVKERGSNGALRSHLFAKGRTRRGGSRLLVFSQNWIERRLATCAP
jgi:hypothetical protein